MTYSFVNHSNADIQVWYFQPDKNATLQDTLGSGGTYSPSASVGQDWEIANATGGCLAIFTITSSGTVTVGT